MSNFPQPKANMKLPCVSGAILCVDLTGMTLFNLQWNDPQNIFEVKRMQVGVCPRIYLVVAVWMWNFRSVSEVFRLPLLVHFLKITKQPTCTKYIWSTSHHIRRESISGYYVCPEKVLFIPRTWLLLKRQLFFLPPSKAWNRIELNCLRLLIITKGSATSCCHVCLQISVTEEVLRWNFKHYSMSLPGGYENCKKNWSSCTVGEPIRNLAWKEWFFFLKPMS